MKNENGKEMTEKEIIKECLDLVSEVCCLLFETESKESHAAAFMADNLIKYLQVIYRDDRILDATCDYEKYEHRHYLKSKKNIEVIK